MPAVTSVHNEGRWIGGSWVSDEVGRGHGPGPDQGRGSRCSPTMGRSSHIHAGEATWPRHHAEKTPTALTICPFWIRPCPCRPCRRRLPLAPTRTKTKKTLDENVCGFSNLSCRGRAPSHKTTHGISWHESTERQVKTERRTLPECQLGLYMRLRTPRNMCSTCPISCWAALFYCSVMNPEICLNSHICHCSDMYATAVFKRYI